MTATDPLSATRIRSGLDVASPDTLTDQERDAFHAHYEGWKGELLRGHEFLLEFRPDVLKRYLASIEEAGSNEGLTVTSSMGFVHFYSITGWSDGIRQHMHLQQQKGVPRAMFLDVLGIAALHAGPRGMQWVADGVTDELRVWEEPEPAHPFPDGWAFDPDAFSSGLDFSNPDLSEAEAKQLLCWYERVLGNVPRPVRFLAEYRPRLLKAYRNRFEHAITDSLPKQVMPYCLLQLNLYRANGEGIRGAVQLGQGFGMTSAQLLDAATRTFFYGGLDTIALLDQYAGDLLTASTASPTATR